MCVSDCVWVALNVSLSESLGETDCTHSWGKHWTGVCVCVCGCVCWCVFTQTPMCVSHMCPPPALLPFCFVYFSLWNSIPSTLLEPHDSAGWNPQRVNIDWTSRSSGFLSQRLGFDKSFITNPDHTSSWCCELISTYQRCKGEQQHSRGIHI